ncbi:hypothetical protein HYDPIDRAFT_109651 [Hydnomerulius pinastri MD-312]|nr:hypothetical protein HYDPIDRAFT_109651 [Hydnomerulius pinastri MD-312]
MHGLDISELDASIQTLEQELHDLNSNKNRLLQTKEELQRQLDEVDAAIQETDKAVRTKQSARKEHNNSLLPIMALPPEILSMIFREVVGEFVEDASVEPSNEPIPLLLSWVCRKWRTISIENPTLWTTVNLRHCLDYNIEPYLARSAGLKLDITSGTWDQSRSYDRRRISSFIKQLVQHAYRWHRLVLAANRYSRSTRDALRRQLSANTVSLHTIDLENGGWGPSCPTFENLWQPNLKTLRLCGIYIPERLKAPNVEYLILQAPDDTPVQLYATIRPFLVSTTCLRLLNIDANLIDFRGAEVDSISFAHLQELMLYFDEVNSEQLRYVLTMVSAPALETIELAAKYGWRQKSGNGEDFKPFFMGGQPRYPTVTCAVFYNVIRDREDVEDFVRAFPDVKNITLSSSEIPFIISTLEPVHAESTVSRVSWPKLEEVRVSAIKPKLCMPELCDWLERWQNENSSQLQVTLIRDCDSVHPEDDIWLERLLNRSQLKLESCSKVDGPWMWCETGDDLRPS